MMDIMPLVQLIQQQLEMQHQWIEKMECECEQQMKVECECEQEEEMHHQQMEHEQEMHSQMMEVLINQLPTPGSPSSVALAASVPSFTPTDTTSKQKKALPVQKRTTNSPHTLPKGTCLQCGKTNHSMKDCWFINSK